MTHFFFNPVKPVHIVTQFSPWFSAMGQTEQFSSSAAERAVSSHSPTKSHTNTVFWKSLADLKPWWKNCSRAATKLFSPHSRTVRLPLCATHINTSMHKSKCWYNVRSLTFGKWRCYFVCYLVHTCNEACLCGQVTWQHFLLITLFPWTLEYLWNSIQQCAVTDCHWREMTTTWKIITLSDFLWSKHNFTYGHIMNALPDGNRKTEPTLLRIHRQHSSS